MKKTKVTWSKPQLIILGRGKSEENVLLSCKDSKLTGPPTVNNCKSAGVNCSAMGIS